MANVTKVVSREYLTDEIGLPYDADDGVIIEVKDVRTNRWSYTKRIIFTDPFDFLSWRVDYQEGATESQETQPWEFEDYVKLTRVEGKEVTRIEWVDVQQ